jgi:hypothetical protein
VASGGVNLINPLWVKIKWKFKLGSYYYDAKSGVWTTDVNYEYNELYISNFNDSQEYKIVSGFRRVNDITLEDADIEFILSFDTTVDVLGTSEADAITKIKAITTPAKRVGDRIKSHVSYTSSVGATEKDIYHVLIDDNPANNGLQTVVPNDFDDDTNQKVWDLEESIVNYKSRSRSSVLNNDPATENIVEYVYLDNVIVRHLPKAVEPPANVTIEKTNDINIKLDFEDDYLLNDIDIDNINNSERTYVNFLKRLDGNPTQVWTRSYRAGSDKLLALLADDFAVQYRLPSNKLTGSLHTDRRILPSSVLTETQDNDRKYMFMGYELHTKTCDIVFDLTEIKDVTNPDSEDQYADFNTDFSLDFNS